MDTVVISLANLQQTSMECNVCSPEILVSLLQRKKLCARIELTVVLAFGMEHLTVVWVDRTRLWTWRRNNRRTKEGAAGFSSLCDSKN
jgi:hypothetical protein